MSRYETLLVELLRRLDEKADRIATALEKLSPPGGQDREEDNMISICLPGHSSAADRKALGDVIRGILSEQFQEDSSQQRPCPTEHTQNRDEELRPGEPDQQSDTP